MFQVSPAMIVSFYLAIYLEYLMNIRQSVVYLSKAKRRRQMSLQVDRGMWNELNKPHPLTKKNRSWNCQLNTQCYINKGNCSLNCSVCSCHLLWLPCDARARHAISSEDQHGVVEYVCKVLRLQSTASVLTTSFAYEILRQSLTHGPTCF